MAGLDTGLHYPIKVDELPLSWVAAYVGEFCLSIHSGFACGQHSDSDIGIPHLRPMNISREGVLDFNVIKFVESSYDARRLREGDVLFNNTNSPELIGKTAYVNANGAEVAFSNHMTRLQFHNGIAPKFAAYQLHYLWMARYFLHGCVKHVNQASISAGDLATSIPFVAPPTNEQHRIVAKIEELLSELDKGIESLRTAQAQLKVYRQALLKHAFEGKLTARWRADNPDQLETAEALLKRIQEAHAEHYRQQLADWEAASKQGSKPKAAKSMSSLSAEEMGELPDLPAGWVWEKLERLVTGIDQGWSPKCESRQAVETEWGVIKTTAIQHGRFNDMENKALPATLRARAQHQLSVGDILVTRAGPRVRVGVCCLVKKVRDRLMNCDKVYRLRAVESLCSPDYLELVLNSPRILDAIEKTKSGINDSGVNLNQGAFLKIAIPYCTVAEQRRVLLEVDEKISEADNLAETITTSLQQAEVLRQSILKKAFSGQLVPQDPHDEPAAVLLERIKAEKSVATPSRKARK